MVKNGFVDFFGVIGSDDDTQATTEAETTPSTSSVVSKSSLANEVTIPRSDSQFPTANVQNSPPVANSPSTSAIPPPIQPQTTASSPPGVSSPPEIPKPDGATPALVPNATLTKTSHSPSSSSTTSTVPPQKRATSPQIEFSAFSAYPISHPKPQVNESLGPVAAEETNVELATSTAEEATAAGSRTSGPVCQCTSCIDNCRDVGYRRRGRGRNFTRDFRQHAKRTSPKVAGGGSGSLCSTVGTANDV